MSELRVGISRRFVAATEKQMADWLGRDLSAIDLVVLMIDGVYVDEDHVLLVALGFDAATPVSTASGTSSSRCTGDSLTATHRV